MTYLLDTNVVSEARKPRKDPGVSRWLTGRDGSTLFISVMVIAELRRGAALMRRRDEAQAEALDRWVDETLASFGERILPITADVADRWGRLHRDRPLSLPDAFMAATAVAHGLVLVTRNVKDYEGLPVELLNPFSG